MKTNLLSFCIFVAFLTSCDDSTSEQTPLDVTINTNDIGYNDQDTDFASDLARDVGSIDRDLSTDLNVDLDVDLDMNPKPFVCKKTIQPQNCDSCEGICLRNVCLKRCSSTENWDESLAKGLRPIANYCIKGGRLGAAGDWTCEDQNPSFYLAKSASQGDRHKFELSAFDVDLTSKSLGEYEVISPRNTFLGFYSKSNPGQTRSAFGYTLQGGGEGELLIASSKGITPFEAKGNFDVAWKNDNEVWINGLSLENAGTGSGIYRILFSNNGTPSYSKLINDLGDASGTLAFSDDFSKALVGSYSIDAGHQIYFVDTTRNTPYSLKDQTYKTAPSDFELIAGQYLTAYSADYTSLETRRVNWKEESIEGPVFLAKDPFLEVIGLPGQKSFFLLYREGALLVEFSN